MSTPPVLPSLTSLPHGYTALVLGASGALGAAFADHLQADPRCGAVWALSRRSQPGFDLEDSDSLAALAPALTALGGGRVQVVIDATGALELPGFGPGAAALGPEKRLDDVDATRLQRSLQINAIGPALLLRHLLPLLAVGERVIWAKLSARVGSIEDNHKGGWYGYRASKAALNMLLQSAAIEIHRRRPEAVIAALQPGTVRSRLTQRFVAQDTADDPVDAARDLLAVLDALPSSDRAHFVDRRGAVIPW